MHAYYRHGRTGLASRDHTTLRTLGAVVGTMILAVSVCSCSHAPYEGPEGPLPDQHLRLLLPQEIDIQAFTKVRSWDGDDIPDGLEVVVRPVDYAGDPIKAIGSFQFELFTFRQASADPKGQRIGFWQVELLTADTQQEYWDSMTSSYMFRLAWEGPSPKPGKYVLQAVYQSPYDYRCFDEMVLTSTPDRGPLPRSEW